MSETEATKSRRNWLKMLAAGVGGAALGGVGVKCCTGKKGLPNCAVQLQPRTLTVVVHGMMVIGFFQDKVRLALPYITGHARLAGNLENGLQYLDPGWYSLAPQSSSSAPAPPPDPFDKTHEILIPKTMGLNFRPAAADFDALGERTAIIDIPRPTRYKPFRIVKRTLTGTWAATHPVQPVDFPLGHVFQYSWPATAPDPALVGVTDPHFKIDILVSNNVFSTFHVYHQNPLGAHHAHQSMALNALFDQPSLDVDIKDDTSSPPAGPGCDLQAIGLSALDECDLSEIDRYAVKNLGGMGSRDASDPASCLNYIYDDTVS
jgi:hypothetical protein